MSDTETKEKRSRTRKRNMHLKALYDTGDHKGAFKMKVVNPKKGEYRRERIRINKIDDFNEESTAED